MKIPRFRTLMGLCAILAFPWCLLLGGTDEAAVLRSSGAVVVNGTGAPDTTALFKGDQVQTANGGIVTISSPGSSVFVPSNSQVTFKGSSVNVAAGTARISTTKGMAAQADSSVISPASGKANFEISRVGNDVFVHASSGSLTVNTAGKTFAVPEGSTRTINAATGKVVNMSPAVAAQGGTVPRQESLFSLNKALEDSTDKGINYCWNTKLCHRGAHTSGVYPCHCRKL